MSAAIIRIRPFEYCHVLDNNTNVTTVITGPTTYSKLEHQKVDGPFKMVVVPPRHYVVVANPCERDAATQRPLLDRHGNVVLRHGDEEIRFEGEPFALAPGEKLVGKVTPLVVVAPNSALRIRCMRDFEKHVAGDEWLFAGPATYRPRIEESVLMVIRASLIKPNQALRLRARRACVDSSNVARKAGEEWLIRTQGAYLPAVDEEVIDVVNAHVLTPQTALHLRAKVTFTDVYKAQRKAGEEWLVTLEHASVHIPDVYEEVVGLREIVTLTSRQYAVVLDPYDAASGKNQLGQRVLRKGESSFFLWPGERLEGGTVQNVIVLTEQEALLLRAKESYGENQPGDRWLLHGPTEYVPPVQLEILERRRAIPLDTNEGIYVRDIASGKVRAERGRSYMLKANEELWEKTLPPAVEALLQRPAGSFSRVVNYAVPYNAAVQIYDYKEKKARTIFGPDLISLGPDEQFTLLSLSGGKPKKPHQIKSLALLLGPDFSTDIVVVETSDHARLSLKLSYSWRFVSHDDRIFSVPDFVGDMCKAIASLVRGAVAQTRFEVFHKESARIIRSAVFGVDEATGRIRDGYTFKANDLLVTNIDIQSVEPVDQRTRDSLQKSVQLAIEITTKSQEATARHEAERLEQGARGRLERQKIVDEAQAEESRKALLELKAHSAAVESTGHATAEAKARSEAQSITSESEVKVARLHAEASRLSAQAQLSTQVKRQELEIAHRQELDALDVERQRKLAELEAEVFRRQVAALGPETIEAMARAGEELQARLLKGLGLSGFVVTDGRTPTNLFNVANGMMQTTVAQ